MVSEEINLVLINEAGEVTVVVTEGIMQILTLRGGKRASGEQKEIIESSQNRILKSSRQ